MSYYDRYESKRREIVKDYASWTEYRAALTTVPIDTDTASYGGHDWSAGVNFREALDLSDKGWPEGMAHVRKIALPVVREMSGEMEHADMAYDVTGAAFDVGEYLNGTPECWINPLHVESKPCISIAVNIVSSGGIPAKHLMNRGAAVVALAMTLERSGYAVRVYAVEGQQPDYGTIDVWHRVCLTDDEGGSLDTDRLLFALAHPAAARQLGYALAAKLANPERGNCNDLSIGWAKGDKSGKGCHGPAGWSADFELDAPYLSDANWESAESVQAWVRRAYEQLTGVEQHEE